MKNRMSTLLLILIFVAGLAILLYPSVSDYWNSRVQSRAIVDYESALANMSAKDYSELFAAADDYNRALTELAYPLMYYATLDEDERLVPYSDILNINGNGIMGYIIIESLGVELPIYHGTSAAVLNVAVGHLEGSSLPAGGESTHCVLSAHRGLPSARLFTDLDKLKLGERFQLNVLDRVLVYEVDNISIVEPNDVESLYVQQGQDRCTLVTCTPYGINSHRLLVGAHRVQLEAVKQAIYVPSDGFLIDRLIIATALAVLILIVLLVFLMIRTSRRR